MPQTGCEILLLVMFLTLFGSLFIKEGQKSSDDHYHSQYFELLVESLL